MNYRGALRKFTFWAGWGSVRPEPSWIPGFCLILAAAAVHGIALPNPYYFDDFMILRDNPWLHGVIPPKGWFTTFFFDQAHLFPGYRPLLMLSFWVSSVLTGGNEISLRAGNLALHTLNALLVARLVRLLVPGSPRSIAWLTALLFLVHPLQTLPVNFLWKRSSLLEASLILCGLSLHVAWRRRARYPVWGAGVQALIFSAGLLVKESGLLGPVLFLLYDAVFRPAEWLKRKSSWILYLSFVLIGGLFLWFRFGFVDSWLSAHFHTIAPSRVMTRESYFFTSLTVLPLYLWRCLVPNPLLLDDPPMVYAFPAAGAALTFLLLALTGLLAVRFRREKAAVFSLAAFWALLLPTAGAVTLPLVMDGIRLYLPLVFFCLLLTLSITALLQKAGFRFRPIPVILALAAVYGAHSVLENLRYRYPPLIWRDIAEEYPESGMAWANFGITLEDIGNYRGAVAAFSMASHAAPGNLSYTIHALHNVLRSGGEPDEIRPVILGISTENLTALDLVNLANIAREIGEYKSARAYLLEAIARKPDLGPAYVHLGAVLEWMGDLKGARIAFWKALEIMPENTSAREGLRRVR
jgi:tetratricopeptide (TPR) repeat protein